MAQYRRSGLKKMESSFLPTDGLRMETPSSMSSFRKSTSRDRPSQPQANAPPAIICNIASVEKSAQTRASAPLTTCSVCHGIVLSSTSSSTTGDDAVDIDGTPLSVYCSALECRNTGGGARMSTPFSPDKPKHDSADNFMGSVPSINADESPPSSKDFVVSSEPCAIAPNDTDMEQSNTSSESNSRSNMDEDDAPVEFFRPTNRYRDDDESNPYSPATFGASSSAPPLFDSNINQGTVELVISDEFIHKLKRLGDAASKFSDRNKQKPGKSSTKAAVPIDSHQRKRRLSSRKIRSLYAAHVRSGAGSLLKFQNNHHGKPVRLEKSGKTVVLSDMDLEEVVKSTRSPSRSNGYPNSAHYKPSPSYADEGMIYTKGVSYHPRFSQPSEPSPPPPPPPPGPPAPAVPALKRTHHSPQAQPTAMPPYPRETPAPSSRVRFNPTTCAKRIHGRQEQRQQARLLSGEPVPGTRMAYAGPSPNPAEPSPHPSSLRTRLEASSFRAYTWVKAFMVWLAFLTWSVLLFAFLLCYKKQGDCTLFGDVLQTILNLPQTIRTVYIITVMTGTIFMLSSFFETLLEVACYSLNVLFRFVTKPFRFIGGVYT